MKQRTTLRLITGFATVLLASTCLAGTAGMKNARLRVAAIETPPLTETKILNKAAETQNQNEQELLAMARRIQEDAMLGAPASVNVKASVELSKSCTSGTNCLLQLVVENKGNIPVSSPILASLSLDVAGGKNAGTTTTGWVCGYADPKLTCASTGIALQPNEKARFIIDWETPDVSAAKTAKVCFSLVWPGRPKDGVYRADQIAAVQFALKRAGFEPGAIDGRIRPKTLQAIRLLRDVVNIPGPSQITPDLLQNLFGEVGKYPSDADSSDDVACADIMLKPSDKKVIASAAPAQPEAAPVPSKAELPDLPALSEKEVAARAEAEKIRTEAKKAAAEAKAEREAKKAAAIAEADKIRAEATKAIAIAKAEKEAKQAAARAEADKIRAEASAAKIEQDAKRAAALAEAEKIRAEAAKPAAPVAVAKTDTKASAIPQPVRVIKSDDTKTAVAEVPKPVRVIKSEPAKAAPVKAEAAKATPVPAPAVEEPKVAVRVIPMQKETERLEPSAKAPKTRTTVRSTAMPDDLPEIDIPAPVVEETIVRETPNEVYAPRDSASTITLRDDRDDGLVYRSTTADSDEEYYEIDHKTGQATLKPPRIPEMMQRKSADRRSTICDCRSDRQSSYSNRRKDDRLRRRASLDKLPSGSDIVAGWPYRN
ncbi:MAG: hypothetical protein V4691_00205 [Pseudomonadota bacterium]